MTMLVMLTNISTNTRYKILFDGKIQLTGYN